MPTTSPRRSRLINKVKPDLVINMALPYQDLPIMDACLETGVHYMDTANYEPRDVAKFEYSWQWKYQDRYKDKGIMAILGCGFDPGPVEHLLRLRAGVPVRHHRDHRHHRLQRRQPRQGVRHQLQSGDQPARGDAARQVLEGRQVDRHRSAVDLGHDRLSRRSARASRYLIYHEEEESLVENIRGLKQIRFWMTFSDNYIKHLEVLQNVGMTRIDPVMYKGNPVIPMEFLKELLPPPSSLGESYTGRTSIGCIFTGTKDGKPKRAIIYNVCEHAQGYKETGAQAVSYTTGVPPVVGAMMLFKGAWKGDGVFNVEQLPSKPFMDEIGKQGLPWHMRELSPSEQSELFAVKTCCAQRDCRAAPAVTSAAEVRSA